MKNHFFKSFFIFTLFNLFTLSFPKTYGQAYQTIFGNGSGVKVSGYGAILNEFSFGENGKNSEVNNFYSVGIEGGILLNQQFVLGLYGMSSVAPYNIADTEQLANLGNGLMFIQTGLNVAYKIFPGNAVHLCLGARAGYGRFQQIPEDPYNYNDNWRTRGVNYRYPAASSFIITPYADLEVNFFPWMRMNAGAGYRTSVSEKVEFISEKAGNSLTFQAGFSFGGFKNR